VVEAAQHAVATADDDDALAGDVVRDVVARLAQLVGAAEVVPAAEEDPLALELEHLRADVIGAAERGADLDRHDPLARYHASFLQGRLYAAASHVSALASTRWS